jgi:hypothetical protein
MAKMKGNKGEWAELYAFCKILSSGLITSSRHNPDGQPKSLKVTRIIRTEHEKDIDYVAEGLAIKIQLDAGQSTPKTIRTTEFQAAADAIFNAIKTNKSTFEVPAVADFFTKIGVTSLKSTRGRKTDLVCLVHDEVVNADNELHLSIKSFFTAPPSLLNASSATIATFCLDRIISPTQMSKLNRLGPKALVSDLKNQGIKISFRNFRNEKFEANLRMIDTEMPQMLGELILLKYLSKGTEGDMVSALTLNLVHKDPLRVGDKNAGDFYTNKVKNLLTDVAFGLTPTMQWDGEHVATDFLLISSKGELACVRSHYRKNLRTYLLESTRFDTPSSRAFGEMLRIDGKTCVLNLNFQIRLTEPRTNGVRRSPRQRT